MSRLRNAKEQVPDEEIRAYSSLCPYWCIAGPGGLALVGMPFFSIFFSEFIILWAAFQKVAMSKDTFWIIAAVCLFLISVDADLCWAGGDLGRILLVNRLSYRAKYAESTAPCSLGALFALVNHWEASLPSH